jgi:hypothetical protein
LKFAADIKSANERRLLALSTVFPEGLLYLGLPHDELSNVLEESGNKGSPS